MNEETDKPTVAVNAVAEIKSGIVPSFFCCGVAFGWIPGIVRLSFFEDRLSVIGKELQRIEHVDLVIDVGSLRAMIEHITKNLDLMEQIASTPEAPCPK